jgi:chemotaxis protein MotB
LSRRRATPPKPDRPAWLLTYTDLVTLLFTFFVFLTAGSVIDEKAKVAAINSVSASFSSSTTPLPGKIPPRTQPDETTEDGSAPARIPQDPPPAKDYQNDLSPLRNLLFDAVGDSLDFQENKHVQILSMGADVLFTPGSSEIAPQGANLLDRLLPYLRRLEYPLLVAGHAATRREEEGKNYVVDLENQGMDSTWRLSFQRALTVYLYLSNHGLEPGRLSMEAFGSLHPRFSENTPEGRRKNRRVDLVIDKRNQEWLKKLEGLKDREEVRREMYYRGFKFDFSLPKTAPGAP